MTTNDLGSEQARDMIIKEYSILSNQALTNREAHKLLLDGEDCKARHSRMLLAILIDFSDGSYESVGTASVVWYDDKT